MVQLIRLLFAIGKAANGLANLITALSFAAWLHSVEMGAMMSWLRGASPEQNEFVGEIRLNPDDLALFAEFQRNMDLQYQVSVLQQSVLTLPALPEEGF